MNTLPIVNEEESSLFSTLSPVLPEKISILIVDDDLADLAHIRRLLTKFSFEFTLVEEATSSEEALKYLQHQPPACCIVDYCLPGKNGLDFVKQVKRLSSNIAIVVLTGQGDEALAVDMMRSGAHDYIVKSQLGAERLYHAVKNAIRMSSLQKQLFNLAHFDALTGLLNRALFLDRLQHAINQCQRYHHECALLYLDIDNFKQINDSFGHDSGDFVIKTVADVLRKSCRQTDTIARLGGDEFVILFDHAKSAVGNYMAEKIIQALNRPILISGERVRVTVSIGVAHYPVTVSDPRELLKQADEMLYKAKRMGRSCYMSFTEGQKALWDRRRQLEVDLADAISNQALTLVYQPIFSLYGNEVTLFEVLCRWPHINYTVSATELIQLVDYMGLMEPFHQWLLDAACAQLSTWQKEYHQLGGSRKIRFCINIPANCCHNQTILLVVRSALKKYALSADQLELEITETTLMKYADESAALLAELHQEGVRIAVDDFGAGYSSMTYLTKLPIDTLKIDQHFFVNLAEEPRNLKVVEAITVLGHSLGLKVVAEGVESEYQWKVAESLGCDFVQGFYKARPQAPDDWQAFIAKLGLETTLSLSLEDPHQEAAVLEIEG